MGIDMAKVIIEGVSREYAHYFAHHVQQEHRETKGHVRVIDEDSQKVALNEWWKELKGKR